MLCRWLVKVNADSPALYRVRRLHTDNWGEFIRDAFKALCTEFQIVQTFLNAYESRQNPYAERAIGIMNRLTLTLMATANAPHHLWWRAQVTASEVLNAYPSEGLSDSPDALYYQ